MPSSKCGGLIPRRKKRRNTANPMISHGTQSVSAKCAFQCCSWARSIGNSAGALSLTLLVRAAMRILVTGGCGFIGSNFIRYILQNYKTAFVTNADQMDALMTEHRFYALINFAAESHVDRSINDPLNFIHTNVIGTSVLLDCARRHGVQRFVQISTDEVYGSLGPSGRFTEQSSLDPSSPYSASKAGADLLALACYRTYGQEVIV